MLNLATDPKVSQGGVSLLVGRANVWRYVRGWRVRAQGSQEGSIGGWAGSCHSGLQESWAGISPLVDGAGYQGLCLQGPGDPQLVPLPFYWAGLCPRVAEGSGS